MADKSKLFAFLKSISNRPNQRAHEFRFILPVSVNRNVCACIYIWQIRRRQACTNGDSDRETERKFLAALAKRSASSKWNRSRGPITQPFWFLFLYHTNEAAALDLRERAEDEPISFRPRVGQWRSCHWAAFRRNDTHWLIFTHGVFLWIRKKKQKRVIESVFL